VSILLCPFCGRSADFINRDYWDNITPKPSDSRWDIGCGTAGCILERGADWFCTQDEILVMWNKRPGVRVCCNSDCGWIGYETDCVHPKHVPDERLCPKCNEVTEAVIM
jgi:hypothetical protein